jgi:hypothetical protein
MSRCQHHCDCEPARPRRRSGLFSTLFQLVLLYALLVFGGGTLIRSGHPVGVELGRLIHTVAFVDPIIGWADANDHGLLEHGMRTVSRGIDVGQWSAQARM